MHLRRKSAIDEFQYRLFGNWEWQPLPLWTFNLGAMAEHNNIVENFISPRAAMNYQFSPGQVLRASYTYGNRTPSILESNQLQGTRFADGTLIDLDVNVADGLRKSVVKEQEIGYLGNFHQGKVSVDLRLFRTEADNVVGEFSANFPDLDGKVSTVANTMDWVTKGFDTQIQIRPDDRTLLSFQYAYTDFYGSRLKRRDIMQIRELGRELPRHNANLLVSRSFGKGWNAGFVLYHLSRVAWRQGDLIKSHDRLDLSLAKTFNIGSSKAKAELVAHNLLGSYEEFEDFNIFETRVFLRLKVDLN